MNAAAERVHFPATGPFYADLKQRVAAHFERTGTSQHGGWSMRVKTAVLLTWLAGSWALLMFAPVSPWLVVLLTISIGLAMAGTGFSVMHDANHGSYSASARVNRILSYTCDFLGGSSHVWRQKHNILHHTYTNISGLDADLDAGPLLRFAPWQPRQGFHRFQHLYVWALYGVFPLRWFLTDDFRDLATGNIRGAKFQRPQGWSLFATFAGKAVFYAWAFVIPAVLHPTWWLIPLWLLCSFTLGNTLATVFQLAHCAANADFHETSAGQTMATEWAIHQVTTTVDFARESRFLSWFLGGLNFQVEHHLFPRVCHVHYPALAKIVEETCLAHGVRYRAESTLAVALAANVRWLRDMGRAAPVLIPASA